MKTKAIRIHEHGGPEVLKLEEAEVGDPGPDEVRIRNHAVGLNFIDIYYRTGLYGAALPHGLGFEGAGIVEAVGDNIKFLKEGDRVAYGQGQLGAYCDVRVKRGGDSQGAYRAVPVPPDLSAAGQRDHPVPCGRRRRGLDRLPVGALGVRLIGTVSSVEKAALAKKYGAWATIDYSQENFVGRVKELTKGEKVPVVYDSVGKDTWEGSLDCLRPRGLMVSFGNASGAVTGVNLGILASKGSLFVTRPTLGTYAVPRSRLEASAEELFDLICEVPGQG